MKVTKKHIRPDRFSSVFLSLLCLFVAGPRVFADPQQGSVIIVNERALVGPNSAAQLRGGRLYLPIATIAQALGDAISSDAATRIVTIRRQNGITAVSMRRSMKCVRMALLFSPCRVVRTWCFRRRLTS